MRRHALKPLPSTATLEQKEDRRDLCRIYSYNALLHSLFHADCAPFVGSPSLSVLACNGAHGLRTACPICHWNYCQICTSSSGIICVQCNTDPCKGCPALSCPSFSGWSGICVACKPPALCAQHPLTAVCAICKWNCCKACDKERPMADRVGGTDWYCSCSGASDVVVEISDDEEAAVDPDEARRAALQKEFPNFQSCWPLPPVGTDASDGYTVLLDHSSVQFKRIASLVLDKTKEGLEPDIVALLTGYPDSAVVPRSFKIFDIKHIVDPLKYECYQACMNKMDKINSKRYLKDQYVYSDKYMFHGTKRLNESSIIQHGFLTGKCVAGLHGDGIYFSRYTLIPDSHTDRDGLRLMFVCRVLQGRPGITGMNVKMPPDSYDSGGDSDDGRGHKTVIFDNNHCYAEFAVYYGEDAAPLGKHPRA